MPEGESKLTLNDLLEEGFTNVTIWCPHNQRIKLETLEWPECSGWLYAFVVDDCVRYIGMTARVVHVYGLAIADDAKRSAEEARLRIVFNPDWNRC